MRIINDEHIENDLKRMLNDGETLRCGVWGTIMADLKKILILGGVFGGGAGAVLENQYCIFGATEKRLLFSLISSANAEEIGAFSIDFDEIDNIKMKKGLFGRIYLFLDIKDNGTIKISVTSSAIGSKITKQKEMREKLIQILSDKFIN